jgi:hypothetical protein
MAGFSDFGQHSGVVNLKLTVDLSSLTRGLNEFQRTQVPFAAALALTRTAQRCQANVRGEMGSRFTLRNAWTKQGIVIKPATKTRLQSEVFVGDLWDYLKQQEGGALKVPIGGRKYLAVPTLAARGGSASGIIGRAMRPRQLLSNKNSGAMLIKTKNGLLLIVQRVGRQLVTLYVLVPHGNIKDRLGLVDISQKTVAAVWEEEFAKALAEAERTAR